MDRGLICGWFSYCSFLALESGREHGQVAKSNNKGWVQTSLAKSYNLTKAEAL